MLSLGVLGPEVVPDVISVKFFELQETMSIQIALGTEPTLKGIEGRHRNRKRVISLQDAHRPRNRRCIFVAIAQFLGEEASEGVGHLSDQLLEPQEVLLLSLDLLDIDSLTLRLGILGWSCASPIGLIFTINLPYFLICGILNVLG